VGCLYVATSPSGKEYVGISRGTAVKRWKTHAYNAAKGSQCALHNAIRKYGSAAFSVRTLAVADDWAYLCLLEKSAIAAFATRAPNGYNLTEGGDGLINPAPEVRKRMAKATKDYFATPGNREKVVEANKRIWTPELRAWRAEETRRQMQNPVVAAKLSAARKLRSSTPEERSRLGTMAKKNWEDPELRARMSAASKARWQDPEYRARMSVVRKEQAAKLRSKQ